MSDPALAYDDNRPWTYKEYREWELKPGERYELVDGVAYAMSGPNTEHQLISSILHGEFYNFLKGKICKVFHAPFDVRLFYEEDESDDTVVQPDVVVVCDPKKLGKEGCRGAPDLVIEILSPFNTAMEMSRKLILYRDAGVPEYWVVVPEIKNVQIYHFEDEHYGFEILQMGDALKPKKFPGLEIPLNDLFAGETA
jgi:Uma2 family endonuclease